MRFALVLDVLVHARRAESILDALVLRPRRIRVLVPVLYL